MVNQHIKVIKSTADWEATLKEAGGKPVLVDFFAEWCGPCKMIAPQFDKLASDYHDKIVFLKVDVDQCEEVAAKAGVSAMPTFQIWVSGARVDSLMGANPVKLNELVTKYSTATVAA